MVDQILSGNQREDIVLAIHEYLSDLAASVRAGKEDISRFVVTKGLNKNPKDYPDCKGQAHLQVALAMLKANRPVNIGDHIPYVICVQVSETVDSCLSIYQTLSLNMTPNLDITLLLDRMSSLSD